MEPTEETTRKAWVQEIMSHGWPRKCAICKESKDFMSFCPRGLKIRTEWAGWRMFEVCNNCCMKEQDKADDEASLGVGI